MPLALVIARYFAYIVVGLAATWLVLFAAFSVSMNLGFVYPANFGPAHAAEVARSLQDKTSFDAQTIPTAYRYLHLDAAGNVVEGDLSATQRADALAAVRAELAGRDASEDAVYPAEPAVFGGGNGTTYTAFALDDGTACILVCSYLPQFADRALRDALPNPQDLLLVAGSATSILVIAAVAHRASRVLTRKMAPLTAAADAIAHQDLDQPVGTSNVRQVDDVLLAMDRMRIELKASLEARFQAERAQREQVAALAHDLKTPLTIVRANAEFVAEEAAALPASKELVDLVAAANDIARGATRLDAYIHLLIEASRGDAEPLGREAVDVAAFIRNVQDEAAGLARAAGISFRAAVDPTLASATILADAPALERAVANVVSNACDHARTSVKLSAHMDARELVLVVDDNGPGFTPAALEHGCERFFRDDSARGGDGHYGIGLFAAAQTLRTHGGSLGLENRRDANGDVLGARVTIRVPRAAGDSKTQGGSDR